MIVILTIGAPGSGKSTWGEKFADSNKYIYLSSDRNRARVGRGEDDQQASAKAFELLKTELSSALKNNKNVVVDATFMSRKARRDFVNISRKYKAELKAVTFELPREIILQRNAKRASMGGRNVPDNIIDRMINNYERPQFPEFDEVIVIDK